MKSRRGISSVVGTVFAIIALSTTVGYITYSMTVLDQYNQSVIARNQQAADIVKEKFQVNSVTFVNNKMNITVTNTGSLPVNFTKIWITNKTATSPLIWVKSYTPTTSVVAPANSLKNIGQNICSTCVFYSNVSYHVKLVTSRGNTNEFDVNSASTAPLNIKLLALPPSIPSGFKTELVMAVTNNGTGVLTNLNATLALKPGNTAICTAGTISPSIYNTLLPGSTAIFSWDVKATGTLDGQSCSYGAYLTNGYSKNYANATITETLVSLSSTTYSQNTGILVLNYTTFRWTVTAGAGSGTWNTGWSPTGTQKAVYTLNMTNNNQTAGANLYISKNTVLFTKNAGSGSNFIGPSYIMNMYYVNNGTAKGYKCSGAQYPITDDFCVSVPPGGTTKLYFFADSPGGTTTGNSLPAAGTAQALSLIMFGKFATSQGLAGSTYGQLLPYIGILTS